MWDRPFWYQERCRGSYLLLCNFRADPSSVALGVLMNKDNTVRQAGGFIIQLMPGASEAVISALERKSERSTLLLHY